jgi:hypothetical protein
MTAISGRGSLTHAPASFPLPDSSFSLAVMTPTPPSHEFSVSTRKVLSNSKSFVDRSSHTATCWHQPDATAVGASAATTVPDECQRVQYTWRQLCTPAAGRSEPLSLSSQDLAPGSDKGILGLIPPWRVLDDRNRNSVLDVLVAFAESCRDNTQTSIQCLDLVRFEQLNREAQDICDKKVKQNLPVEVAEMLVR